MQLGDVVAHLFISYATPDRAIAEEISDWLRDAGHEPFLAHDLREGISVGEQWKQRLYRELRQVDTMIAVVTTSFVTSEWCFAEVGIAGSRGCRLMPLRAEANVVHPLMRELQYTEVAFACCPAGVGFPVAPSSSSGSAGFQNSPPTLVATSHRMEQTGRRSRQRAGHAYRTRLKAELSCAGILPDPLAVLVPVGVDDPPGAHDGYR